MANIAGTEKDFLRGYQDALNRRGYQPTTVRYVDGYQRGLDMRKITDPDPVDDPGYDEFEESCK